MPVRVRLLIVWGLFAAWVGWLGWQSWRHRQFPVVSRAQLLSADLVVVAELASDREGRANSDAKLVTVSWTRKEMPDLKPGVILPIANLPGSVGFRESGFYVLPLTGSGPFRVADMPRSPLLDAGRFKPQIYPDGPEVRAQVRDFYTGQPSEPGQTGKRQ